MTWKVIDAESASKPGEILTVIEIFETEIDAVAFIGQLPDREKVLRGGYHIDGPEEE